MNILNHLAQATILHRDCIIRWKESGVQLCQENFLRLIEENHAFNYNLWHTEDRARRDDMGYEFVYRAKREIDSLNQQRNNRMEAIDSWLVNELGPSNKQDCPAHSETPGMMLDRLSILSLKFYHMNAQAQRTDVDAQHRQTCAQKAQILAEQLQQLSSCLQQLAHDVKMQTRTFKVYHQFKMYNDPQLNPELIQGSA